MSEWISQMHPDHLIPICIKALALARDSGIRAMLRQTLISAGRDPWALPDGFTSRTFDALSEAARGRDTELAADLKAIADYRRPYDGIAALTKTALDAGMIISYGDAASMFPKEERLSGNMVLGGKWTLLPLPDRAGFAVVPKQ